mmetsp:Transcript_92731/g.262232  ORF Transcript_92731/g.262232 Transcript_92731/m.262232 type:complete len:274 (-) Transcript_92731:53-874(-)
MVGFGFMDNTVMLHAGNAIDLTLGVTFGLSTLAAAACGQICSDVAGLSFGGLIEAAAGRLGLPSPEFSAQQRAARSVKRVGLLGGVTGVVCGCSLGLLNLFIIDPHQAGELKMVAASSAAGFSVNISNAERDDVTVLMLEGPESIDGVIAAVTTAMAVAGCVIQDMDGRRGHREGDQEGAGLKFRFCLTKEGRQLDDEELAALGRSIMKACNNPERVQQLAVTGEELRQENRELRRRLGEVESTLELHLLKVTRRGSSAEGEREESAEPSAFS